MAKQALCRGPFHQALLAVSRAFWQIAPVRRALLVLALLLGCPGTAAAATEITLSVSPAVPLWGSTATFSGVVTIDGIPADGQPVELWADTGSGWGLLDTTTTAADGAYTFALPAKGPGSYAAKAGGKDSPEVELRIRPRVTLDLAGLPYPGSGLYLRGRLKPATAGALTLRVGTHVWPVKVRARGKFRAPLPTRDPGYFRATLKVTPLEGFAAIRRRRHFRIRAPYLSVGSSERAVLALERRLRDLHYAIRDVNQSYGGATYEAVLAFQKVHGMSRTGRVDPEFWRVFGRSHVPQARIARGDHIEVSKTRQYLFEVRRGKVVRVVHVSTGATGNTPVGRFRVYLKTPGLNSRGMYYSNYFLRGFAVHGYASVPPWPASHGCVRIPMWLAPGLYARWPLATTIYIYY